MGQQLYQYRRRTLLDFSPKRKEVEKPCEDAPEQQEEVPATRKKKVKKVRKVKKMHRNEGTPAVSPIETEAEGQIPDGDGAGDSPQDHQPEAEPRRAVRKVRKLRKVKKVAAKCDPAPAESAPADERPDMEMEGWTRVVAEDGTVSLHRRFE